MSAPTPISYWDYIRVDDLLELQHGLAEDEAQLSNEEVLFITVHQVFELWFKLVLRELRAARDLFRSPRVAEQELSGAVRSLHRASVIFRRAADHFAVMETMTTREYLAFRDKLLPASGFQSGQMREMEIVLGLASDERVSLGLDLEWIEALRQPDGSESRSMQRVRATLAEGPSLKAAIEEWLFRTPIDGVEYDDPQAAGRLSAFLERFLAAHGAEVERGCERALSLERQESNRARLRARYDAERESVRAFFHPSAEDGGERRKRIRAAMLFIETYRELPLLAWPREFLDGLVELEQQFIVFRQRHARMVERVIGRRTGTGGSAGVDYLDQTALKYRVFRDLWAVRTLQIRAAAAPALENPGYYGFSRG